VVHDLDKQLAELVADNGNPLEDICGAGLQVAGTLTAQSGDVRRFRDRAAYARYGGRRRSPAARVQEEGATACIAAATARSTLPCTASPSSRYNGIRLLKRTWSASSPRGQNAPRGATSAQAAPRQPRLAPTAPRGRRRAADTVS
jgi:hypothetical protein